MNRLLRILTADCSQTLDRSARETPSPHRPISGLIWRLTPIIIAKGKLCAFAVGMTTSRNTMDLGDSSGYMKSYGK